MARRSSRRRARLRSPARRTSTPSRPPAPGSRSTMFRPIRAGPRAPGWSPGFTPTSTARSSNGMPLDARHPTLFTELRRAGYVPTLFGYTDTTPDPRGRHPGDPDLGEYEGVCAGLAVDTLLIERSTAWLVGSQGEGLSGPRSGCGSRRHLRPARGSVSQRSFPPRIAKLPFSPIASCSGCPCRGAHPSARISPMWRHIRRLRRRHRFTGRLLPPMCRCRCAGRSRDRSDPASADPRSPRQHRYGQFRAWAFGPRPRC